MILSRTYLSFLRTLAVVVIAISAISCEDKKAVDGIVYNGPMREGENVTMLYTEKDVLKMKMIGKKVFEFENGDREFPEGLFLEFYNDQGILTSTLTANHAYFFKREYQWRGRGHVDVRNLETKEQLNTEELYWKPDTKRIFTDMFVTIKQVDDVIWGIGLDAAQDLSDYTIRDPKGNFAPREEDEEN